jgi:hypothetical protein
MMLKFVPAILVLAGSMSFTSCISLNTQPPANQLSEVPETSFATFEEVYDSGYWVTMPSNSVITVIGIAGRQANKEAAIAEALADAAIKVALYYGVYGESAVVLNQGSGYLDYFSDTSYRLALQTNPEDYIGDLVFDKDKDVIEKNGSVFVRVQYHGIFNIPSYNPTAKDDVPSWVIDSNVNIPDFLTAVNYSKNKGSPQKTYQASYENAIVSLLPRLEAKTVSEIIEVQGTKINQNISTSSGTLENVIILETWLNKKTNTVWTLLAARQKA